MTHLQHLVKNTIFTPLMRCCFAVFSFFLAISTANAEGSYDINKYNGNRLFLYAYDPYFPQQIKVFAKGGEFINVGASHVGIKEGFIKVYSPKGQLLATFDKSDGDGIINNSIEEAEGPTGGGTLNGTGYKPGVVQAAEDGVYTVYMSYPTFDYNQDWQNFPNVAVGSLWTRDFNQPKNIRRVILAWDITVSQNGAGNQAGSNLIKGRVYSNDLNLIVNQNNNKVSPTFFVLSREGYLYKVEFIDVDPWGFPITSNNIGLVNGQKQPIYKSYENPLANSIYKRTAKITDINGGGVFYYEPQARDTLLFANNKIFINQPATDMPTNAAVTDIFRNDSHYTWLLNQVPTISATLSKFEVNSVNTNCGKGIVELAKGANFTFESNVAGTGLLQLDLNNDGDYIDPEDRNIYALINIGSNKIFWDGKKGDGSFVQTSKKFTFNYKFDLRSGEIHIMFDDVENNIGGSRITRLNGFGAPSNVFYYDHSLIGGAVSGGGTPGNAKPTTIPFTYSNGFGNEKLLDNWTYVEYDVKVSQSITVEINLDCDDHDGDGVVDAQDIDDDNDGVTDKDEFCNPTKGFACLPNDTDPSADSDNDKIPNYLDAINNLTNVSSGCTDANNDGRCDQILALFDIDGDNVPDHYDLDSDNDGITDLDEAGHNKTDADRNGIIDGPSSAFGVNGLFNQLDINDANPALGANYTPWDYDADGVPDHDDLDSDNDGIFDIREADYGYESFDADKDGRIDITSTYAVNGSGVSTHLNAPIGYPKDFDKDGIPDWHDLDSDNDGINDVEEAGTAKLDPDNDGFIGTGKPVVNSNGVATAVTILEDTDKDGIPDWHDYDSDNDGIKDVVEASFPDPDDNGLVGTGSPIVNQWGQPDGFNTSTPPDFDGDGIPDYRDTKCDKVLDKPILTSNGKICPGDEITIDLTTQYISATIFIWTNGKGDTLATSGKTLKIKENDPKAVMPIKVMLSWKTCNSALSDAATINVIKAPAQFTANDDSYKIKTDKSVSDSLTLNDNITNGFAWETKVGTAPSNGTVTVNKDGTFSYNPKAGFDGTDQFTYVVYSKDCPSISVTATVKITISKLSDIDNDGTPDEVDIDDDNDGVTDKDEYCNGSPTKGFGCLPNGADPSADDDGDRILNYLDAVNNISTIKSGCTDANNDGVCDQILAIYDTDGDNVPDHYDLDSDNDGITDLDEAGHKQPDADRNGIIDGPPSSFGINGLYNALDIDDANLALGANYTPWDWDTDGVPDHDDLDSDNDGIFDIRETDYNYEKSDANNDGRIDFSAINPVDINGLTKPLQTMPIGYPKDFDADTVPDWHDLDSDNDGINDVAEGSILKLDPDNDGFIGTGKPTVNQDGVATTAVNNPTDTDNDGIPDWHDYDSDNDGIKDVVEADYPDPDDNGMVGTAIPKINKWGQPDGYNTSNPTDTDGDGIFDFRDTICDLTLNKPKLTNNGKICPGQEIVLTLNTEYSNATKFVWTNGKGEILATSGKTLTLQANEPKTVAPFKVYVEWKGCKSKNSDSISADIIQAPSKFTAVNDEYSTPTNIVLNGNVIKNDDIVASGWTISIEQTTKNGTVVLNNDGSFVYTPNKDFDGTDEFTYIIKYDICKNIATSAKVKITVVKSDLDDCFIPNVITPNNDGDNDVLDIPCSNSFLNSTLVVYNRWGAEVYSVKDYKNDWGGTYNGDLLPSGTYYYIYKLRPDDKECRTGYITIIRN